ncbi:hypothetical protein F1654_02675 [Alkalicaulis satelles]|uniref:Uncharacterized protein n=1 Tax=Alkalicaulis satelles TaxID=2609175 RepID=A0A5M6ZKS1_9PROT|nr:hypothetical protein [Alkalicaulis satelles]KAA5804920.1 hypothetical protein F1654_02675 [Alkalicaulis satelles]
MRANFFTSVHARAVAFLGLLIVVIAVGEAVYKIVEENSVSIGFSFFILPLAVIFLALSLVIEYLARIAAALDRRAAPARPEGGS